MRMGGVGVVVVVASDFLPSGQTHRTSIPSVVVSLTTHDIMYVYQNVHGSLDIFDMYMCMYLYI